MNFYVRSRLFCCCLPVRLGVFVMSLVHFLVALGVAVVSFIAIEQYLAKKVTQTREQEIIIWVIAVFASAMALVSAFGFAGCVAKNLKFVVAYHVMIWSLFAVNVAASIVALFRAFHGDRTQFDERPLTSAGRAEMATGVFINWAIHLYGCHIIGSYVRQLKEERVGYGNMTPWATENGRDVILPTEDSEEGTALPMDKM